MSITKKEMAETKAVWDFLHGEEVTLPKDNTEPSCLPKKEDKPKPHKKISESLAQQRIFRWAGRQSEWPELKLMYHIPNEGVGGNYGRLQKLLAEGMKPGVPDIHLPVAKGGYHGLWIELKVGYNKPTVQQLEWITDLKEQGHYATWVKGEAAAIELIEKYMVGELVKSEG